MGLAENHSHTSEDLSFAQCEDDIEKSVHLNQDGSMTVEMKVQFKIKEEETIKWTTTVSRAGFSSNKNTEICNSPMSTKDCLTDLNIAACLKPTEPPLLEKYNNNKGDALQQINKEEISKESEPDLKSCDYNICQNPSSNMDISNIPEDKVRPHFYRPPTPGPRRVRQNKALVESVTVASDNVVQKKMVGQFSYSEETDDGESKSAYCMVSHSSSKKSSINNPNLSEISDNDLVDLSLENKKSGEMSINVNHKRCALMETTKKMTLEMPDEDTLLQDILEKSVVEEGIRSSLVLGCKSFTPSSRIYHATRPVSADNIRSPYVPAENKEIKRPSRSSIRYSELPQPQNKDRICKPSDLLPSFQRTIHTTCTGNNQMYATVSTSTKISPLEKINVTKVSSTIAETDNQLSVNPECDWRIHPTDESYPPLSINKKKKKKKKKPPLHYLEQDIHSPHSQQGSDITEEGTVQSEEMSQGMCIASENALEFTSQVTDTYSEMLQKRAIGFSVNISDKSISSNKNIGSENEVSSQASVEPQQDGLLSTKKTKANRQLTKVKSKRGEKFSLPQSLETEHDVLVADLKHETEYRENELGNENEGTCHSINPVEATQNSLVESKSLTEVANSHSSEIEKGNILSDGSHKSWKKQKKQKKKKQLCITENKISMSEGADTLDSLKKEHFPDKAAECSLENYVQSWLQNMFSNTVLPSEKLTPISRKEGNITNSKMCHFPIENINLADTDTMLIANKVHVTGKNTVIECNLAKRSIMPLSEMEATEESTQETRGDETDCLTNANTAIMEEAKYLVESDFQKNTNLQVYNEIHEKNRKKLQSEIDTQDINADKRKMADVSVQVDSKIVGNIGTDAQNDCMSSMLLRQIQSTVLSIQSAHSGCIEKSCGLKDFCSLSFLGSSPSLFLAWLLVLNLKENLTGTNKDDDQKTTHAGSEIFTLLQFLKQIAVREKAHDLKTAVLNLQESVASSFLCSEKDIEKPDSKHCSENLSTAGIQEVPRFHENDDSIETCIRKSVLNFGANAEVQEMTDRCESSHEVQTTSDLNDSGAHRSRVNKKDTNSNFSNCSLISNEEVPEENAKKGDSSIQKSQDKITAISFSNEILGTSEEPNLSVHGLTSNDKDHILEQENTEVEDKKEGNTNSSNCILISNVEVHEENEEKADSSLRDSQDKITDTSFNNEESGTSEGPNSFVDHVTSKDINHILDQECSDTKDKDKASANSNNYILTSSIEEFEGNEEKTDSSLQEYQDKCTDTSFNNEESWTSKEPNSTIDSVTSSDTESILQQETSEVEDKKMGNTNSSNCSFTSEGEVCEEHEEKSDNSLSESQDKIRDTSLSNEESGTRGESNLTVYSVTSKDRDHILDQECSDRKDKNETIAESGNHILASNTEVPEENAEKADSSLEEYQDKYTVTSLNNEYSEVSEELNSSVESVTSNERDLEHSEVDDGKDIRPLTDDENAEEQDILESVEKRERPNGCCKTPAKTSTECDYEEDSEQEEHGTCGETYETSTPSSLSFCYESKQTTELDVNEIKEKLQVKELEHGTHSGSSFKLKKCLKSPATSDWSDYRPDTDDSDHNFRASSDLTNESGEEEIIEKMYNTGHVKRTIELLYGKEEAFFKPTFHFGLPYMSKVLQKDTQESQCTMMKESIPLCQEQKLGSVEKRASLTSEEFSEEINKNKNALLVPDLGLNREEKYYNDDSSGKYAKQHCQSGICINEDEGVLIDKGKWLLKENHLIRLSPPGKTGMYGNADTTSTDSALDNNSDDAPYSRFGHLNQFPPLSEISSSDLEDIVKPSENMCSYFSMPHNSDSEQFSDDLNSKSKPNLTDNIPHLYAVHPARTSVEFRLPDNKVHPLEQPLNAEPIQNQPTNRSNANRNAVQEQDSLDKLHAICGQHCPILMAMIKAVNEEDRGYAYQKASDIENLLGLYSLTKLNQLLLLSGRDLIKDENNHLKNNCINKIAYNIFSKFDANNNLDVINRNSLGIFTPSAQIGKNNLKNLHAVEDMALNALEICNHENSISKQVLRDVTLDKNNKVPDTKEKICQTSTPSVVQIVEEKLSPLLTDPAEDCRSEMFHKCNTLNYIECSASENMKDEHDFATEEENVFGVMDNESCNGERDT